MGKIIKDLTGQRFGKLLVLHLDEEFEKNRNNRQRRWICQCDCGVIKSIIGAELTRKNKSQKSCGCESKKRQHNFGKITFKDLTGQHFGELTVLEKIGVNKYKYTIWKCQCNCGNICEITSRELLSGDTISCGCLKNSYREYLIEQFLKKNNIPYKKEYKFSDLIDKFPLRFDFAIFDNNNNLLGLIEHQGEQYFNKNVNWHTETLEQHDKMKKEYCIKNNIQLFEILYNENLEEKLKEILLKLGADYYRT